MDREDAPVEGDFERPEPGEGVFVVLDAPDPECLLGDEHGKGRRPRATVLAPAREPGPDQKDGSDG